VREGNVSVTSFEANNGLRGGASAQAAARATASRDKTSGKKIPFEELDPAQLPPEDRFDIFFDLSAEVYDLFVDAAAQRSEGVLARYWQLGDLVFSDAKIGPAAVRRSKRHIALDGADHVLLHIAPGQTSHQVFGDRVETLDGMAFHLTDLSRPHEEIAGPSNYRSVLLPHRAIGYDPAEQPAYLRFGLATPYGRVLGSAYKRLHERLPDVLASDAGGLADAFCAVVRGGFRRRPAGEAMARQYRAARAEAIRDFVEARLTDPGLGFAAVSRHFGVSRATLFRDFAADGGLEHHIYSRRLERAYVDLAKGPARRGRVAEVAERWCFASSSHFCRRFRTAFGRQPGEVMSLHAKPLHDDAAKETAERPGDFGQILARAIGTH